MNVLKKIGLNYVKNIELFNLELIYFKISKYEYEKLHTRNI